MFIVWLRSCWSSLRSDPSQSLQWCFAPFFAPSSDFPFRVNTSKRPDKVWKSSKRLTKSGNHRSSLTKSGNHQSAPTKSRNHWSGLTKSGNHRIGLTKSGNHQSGLTKSGNYYFFFFFFFGKRKTVDTDSLYWRSNQKWPVFQPSFIWWNDAEIQV